MWRLYECVLAKINQPHFGLLKKICWISEWLFSFVHCNLPPIYIYSALACAKLLTPGCLADRLKVPRVRRGWGVLKSLAWHRKLGSDIYLYGIAFRTTWTYRLWCHLLYQFYFSWLFQYLRDLLFQIHLLTPWDPPLRMNNFLWDPLNFERMMCNRLCVSRVNMLNGLNALFYLSELFPACTYCVNVA